MPASDIGPLLPNGQARDANADAAIPYHRLYVGNLYYNLTAEDIRQVFEPFGELAFVDMPMEPMVSCISLCNKRSRLQGPKTACFC